MTENELKQFWGKSVKIISSTGKTYIGFAAIFDPSDDDEEDPIEASLVIEKNWEENAFVAFSPSDIKTIEIIKRSDYQT